MRRLREKTWHLLDDDSDHVGAARGKAEKVCDFICTDKSRNRIVKVCYLTITKTELDLLLQFDDSYDPTTAIQIYFWRKYEDRPFYIAKLYYRQPDQRISVQLQNLVK
jgi:hypothetical protein